MKFRSTALAAAALLVLGANAKAQDVKFGVQGTLSLPQSDLGDLVDNAMGIGVGANLLIDLKQGHALVPRLDYLAYSGSMNDFFGYETDNDVKLLCIGADYNYYFSGKAAEGGYIGAGLGLVNAQIDASAKHYPISADGSKTSSYLALCGGYAFNPHMALEFRFQTANVGNMEYDVSSPMGSGTVEDDSSRSGQMFNVSFIYRF